MDLSNINAVTFEEFLRDPNAVIGTLAIKGNLVMINSDGSPRNIIMDMDTWALFNQGFETLYDGYGNLINNSPEGNEELFTKIGNHIYDSFPAMFGLEAAEEILNKRQGS